MGRDEKTGAVAMDLKELGFDEWFADERKEGAVEQAQPARVTAVHRDGYAVRTQDGEFPAEASGKFVFDAESELDMPAVGDWVGVEFFNDNTFAIIHELYPRRTLLKRKTAGEKTEFQLIAANIDTALIIQSCGGDYNLRRLERYLVAVRDGGIRPVLLLSKTDLEKEEDVDLRIKEARATEHDLDILAFSNLTGIGLERVRGLILPGRTYCLLGSSGVGKTTLLNSLIGEDLFYTKSIREKDEKGRHATSRRQMVILKGGGMIIDTPGMREMGIMDASEGIEISFPEIEEMGKDCRFKDCTHSGEADCAVSQAVEEGTLSRDRYKSYLKLRRESAYYEMSYLEKRQKDRSFGRMVKSVMTQRKKDRDDF
jgi:ribosome biogenesis GTPase